MAAEGLVGLQSDFEEVSALIGSARQQALKAVKSVMFDCAAKVSPLVTQTHPNALSVFKDSRSLSPALIAAYQTQLPDKALLQAKLHEFYALNAPAEPSEGDAAS